jgi:hypothetical protein
MKCRPVSSSQHKRLLNSDFAGVFQVVRSTKGQHVYVSSNIQEVDMSVLKSLQFVSVPTSFSNDPKLARRNKFLAQNEQQLALAQDENYVVRRQRWVKQADGSKQLVEQPKRVKRWWRTDAAGNCLFILRYGNKLVAVADGKSAIAVGERSNLAGVIEKVIAATRDGELDAAFENAKAMPRTMKKKVA